MKRITALVVAALVMAAIMVAMAMPAFAAPRSPTGTCAIGGPSGTGALGCAGNVGGSIITEQQGCREINRGPFNENEFGCQIFD